MAGKTSDYCAPVRVDYALYCLVLNKVSQAKHWLKRAIEMDPDDPILLYNVACNLATLGETETALKYLEQAVEHGTVSAAWMRNDEDLVSLRAEPRYAALLAKLEQSADDMTARSEPDEAIS